MNRKVMLLAGVAALLMVLVMGQAGFAEQATTEAPQAAQQQTADQGQGTDEMGPIAEAWQEFKVRWQTGGPTMWFLGALALVAVVFTIERFVGMTRSKIVPSGLADRANQLWEAGAYDEIVGLGRMSDSSLGRIIALLAEHRDASYEHLTSAAEDIASRDFELHMRRNYPLLAVGTLSPLLGLMGTVFGLMGAFATIGTIGTMDDPAALAGDIGEALITTATGLIIAVPSLVGYHFFKSRTGHLASLLGEETSNLIHAWFLKGDRHESEA